MKLQRWSLRSKLMSGFGAMTILVFLVGAIDFFIVHKVGSTYADILDKNTKQVVAMLEMSLKVSNLNLLIKEIQVQKDKNLRSPLIKKIRLLQEDCKAAKSDYERIATEGDDDPIYAKVKKSWLNIESKSNMLLDAFAEGNETLNSDFNLIMQDFIKANAEFLIHSQKLNKLQKIGIENQIEQVNEIGSWGEVVSLSLVLFGIFFPIFMGILFSKSIAQALRQISGELSQGANLLRRISGEMASSSKSLSSSTSAQAAALQETMSAVGEMAAMISKNSENTINSQKVSENSSSAATRGQEAVRFMLGSVQEIEESNMEIMNRIETSHREMSEIVQVINEIALKTKVINEIVFQTKLLSFNASVEAARAGEHGKGFAVVAEEVGNLAQMSGSAAKEITQLLDQSVQKVENIVKRTRDEVQQIMAIGSDKVRKGIEGGQRCGDVLSEIVESVTVVHSMLVEIARASGEQATGVNEIENAMNQLDEITQSNNSSAQLSLLNSESLLSQANQIGAVVEELNALLNGSGSGVGGDAGTGTQVPFAPSENLNNVVPIRKKMDYEFKPFHAIASRFESKVIVNGGEASIPNRDDARFEDV
jgi:methyl-accepting chemotaxis protein